MKNKELAIKKAIFNLFIKQYCEFGNFITRTEYLIDYINSFSVKIFKIKISYNSCIVYLKNIPKTEILSSGCKHIKRNRKIKGIRLNKLGHKKFKFNIQNKANLEVRKPENHKQACILVSCKPGIRETEEVYNNLEDSIKKLIDLEKTKEIYKKIEKIMFQKNIYRGNNIKIALSFYLTNNYITQQKISSIMNVESASLRSLSNLIRLYKRKGTHIKSKRKLVKK